MDPFYLSKLQSIFADFFLGIQSIKSERIHQESISEWINLNNSFSYQKYHRYPEQVIISENMSALLHKYMLIICADMLTPDFTKACPGCYWILSFIDTELAKRRALQTSLSPANNSFNPEALLARMQSLLD
jgi:predicted dithiol-disulfide oxidoreductase (DUF899 family)